MPEVTNNRISSSAYVKTWLNPFAKRLTEGVRRENADKVLENVDFIVFNYDRCLEHSLCHLIQNYYLTSQSEASEIVRGAKILHLYGSLGKLPWQTSNPLEAVPFGELINGRDLLEIANKIKTFTEQTIEEDTLAEIKSLVAKCTKIVFLGFGFHDLNMKLLAAKNDLVHEIYGTAFSNSESDIAVSQRLLKACLQSPMLPFAQLPNMTSHDLLTHFGRAICL